MDLHAGTQSQDIRNRQSGNDAGDRKYHHELHQRVAFLFHIHLSQNSGFRRVSLESITSQESCRSLSAMMWIELPGDGHWEGELKLLNQRSEWNESKALPPG
jgi:hypothetical protein